MHRLCKSLFLGGVTRRFPDLNIAFLECGVGLGLLAARRHRRALGEAQPRRAEGESRSGAGRLGPLRAAHDQVRRLAAGHRRRAAREPAEHSRGRRTSGGSRRIPPPERHLEGGAEGPLRAPLLLRLRGGRPHDVVRLFQRQRLRVTAAAGVQLRHRALGRRGHGGRGRRGLGPGAQRSPDAARTSATSPSPTRRGFSPARTRDFFEGTAVADAVRPLATTSVDPATR